MGANAGKSCVYLPSSVPRRRGALCDKINSPEMPYYLPTPCPKCQKLTMQVVEFGPNDMYEARCIACGWRRAGALEAKRMIRKGGIGTTPTDAN
jgi:hypothetical protein